MLLLINCAKTLWHYICFQLISNRVILHTLYYPMHWKAWGKPGQHGEVNGMGEARTAGRGSPHGWRSQQKRAAGKYAALGQNDSFPSILNYTHLAINATRRAFKQVSRQKWKQQYAFFTRTIKNSKIQHKTLKKTISCKLTFRVHVSWADASKWQADECRLFTW